MNKEKFLKELEKRLSILNEKERKDIIEEYKSTIEEKIKNGADEESAVKDFGDIDDLVKEILDAYKINPEYKENDFQKFVNDGENIIKECADTLAKGVKDAAESFKNNNQEINLSLVFEIMIKVFLTIIFIGLLRIPFIIFTHIGNYFFEVLFSPLDIIIKVLWTIFLSVIYLIIVVIVIARFFKQYFIKKDSKDIKENTKKSETKKADNIKEIKEETPKKKQTSNTQISSVILSIAKLLVVFFILIPLICTNIGLITGVIISIYYWIKGINLLGLTLLLSGIAIISIWLTHLTVSILEEKHVKAYLLIIGIFLTIIGGVIFILTLTNIEYIDEMPKQTEIEIMRLVGSSNISIKIPFLIEGSFIGFFGSIIPIGLMIYGYNSIYTLLDGKLLSGSFGELVAPFPFLFIASGMLLLIGLLVGMFGSASAVKKHLKI